MKLKFTISYNTVWGQSLHVIISYISSDQRKSDYDLLMHTQDGCLWALETSVIESRQHPVTAVRYYYQVEDGDGNVIRKEWGLNPRLYPFDSTKDYLFPDHWRDIPLSGHLYTDAYSVSRGFQGGQQVRLQPVPLFRRTIIFRVSAPQLQRGECLGVCGNHPALGNWNPVRYLKMTAIGHKEWMLSVNIYGVSLPVEYKYVVIDQESGLLKAWEEGENRTTGETAVTDGQVLVMYGEELRVKDPLWRCAGVELPVFSLRSKHSFGVGDFGDLKRLVDWAAVTGMKAIQLLPVHDTSWRHTWADSNPYHCVSAFALHPHYLDLEQMGEMEDAAKRNAFNRRRRELNALAYSDYEAVDQVKMACVDELFAQEGPKDLASEEFKCFFNENSKWLEPYTLFAERENQPKEEIWYIQFHLHRQLKAAADYARSKGVFLIGDLPAGVFCPGADVAAHPDFFDLETRMGTMPDTEHSSGQNWGFPVFRKLTAKAINWWHARLRHEAQYFDAIRIDHAESYFRTWAVPVTAVDSCLGHFVPSFPLSETEIEHAGLTFRKELFTRPFVNDRIADKLFGIHAPYVKENFLVKKAYGLYDLRKEYGTQVRIRDHFHGKTDENSLWIRDGLYQLAANVLFIEDARQPGMYHPRFAAYHAPVYEVLNSSEREAFMRLYNSYYHERHNEFWACHARHQFSALFGESRLLLYAADAGLQSDSAARVLESARILPLEVQSRPKSSGTEFAHLESNPYRSVSAVSTHDMAPLCLWWEENPGRTQRYYVSVLQKEGRAPQHLPAHLAEEIIARHLYCPSMLCLLSLQDWLAMNADLRSKDVRAEQINASGDGEHPWKYRMNVCLEDLVKADQYNQKLHTMIIRSRR